MATPTPTEIIAAIDQALYNYAVGDLVVEYMIGGKKVRKSIEEALQIRAAMQPLADADTTGTGRNYGSFGAVT